MRLGQPEALKTHLWRCSSSRTTQRNYRGQGKPIHLIGVKFSREQRQVVAFEREAP